MGRVIEMSSLKNGKASAADIRERLDAGKRAESELVEQRDQAALDEMDGVAGATAKVAALNARIGVVRAERQTLEGVYRLAVERERLADIAGRTKIRTSQMAAFQNHGRECEAAAEDIFGAVASMAAAMRRLGASRRKMVGVVPIGTNLPVMSLGPDGIFGSVLGNLEKLVSSELYRCSVPDADGIRYLPPFAKPPTLNSDDASKMPVAIDIFREGQAAITAEIKAQLEQIEAKELAALGAPLKEAI